MSYILLLLLLNDFLPPSPSNVIAVEFTFIEYAGAKICDRMTQLLDRDHEYVSHLIDNHY